MTVVLVAAPQIACVGVEGPVRRQEGDPVLQVAGTPVEEVQSLWSLVAPGGAVPDPKDRCSLGLVLLIRAIQARDPGVIALADLKSEHIFAALALIKAMRPSQALAVVIHYAADVLFERTCPHDGCPYCL